MCFIEFIKSNINWIKDLFTILFTGTVTIIAILTYRKAKETILQPIRSEVIKTQVAEILEILDFISKYNYSPKSLFDYYDLLRVNLDILLQSFGLIELSEDLRNELNEKVGGWIIFTDKIKHKFVYVNGTYDEFIKSQQVLDDDKIYEIENIDIQKLNVIFFTKTYLQSYKEISRFAENPLMPEDIIYLLMKIKYDGKFNLILNLEETIIEHFKEYKKLLLDKKITYDSESTLNRESYKSFEKKRFNHDSDVGKLKTAIRKHLRIDEKWV